MMAVYFLAKRSVDGLHMTRPNVTQPSIRICKQVLVTCHGVTVRSKVAVSGIAAVRPHLRSKYHDMSRNHVAFKFHKRGPTFMRTLRELHLTSR